MKSIFLARINTYFLCCIISGWFISTMNLSAQYFKQDTSNIFYQIAPLRDFKKAAVSLTFDDSYLDQFIIGLPMLKERSLTGTFYVITKNLQDVLSISSKGMLKDFEIGSHTVSHPNLLKLDDSELNSELSLSKQQIQDSFGKDNGLTISYPWGNYSKKIILAAKQYYMAGRSTEAGYNSLFTLDRYALNVKNFDHSKRIQEVNGWIDYAISNNLWLIEMIHNISPTGRWSVSADSLSAHLDYIHENLNEIWCTTIVNLIRYQDELQSARFSCDICNDTVFKVRLNDFLDDSIYNQDLTLRVKIPETWEGVTVSGNPNIQFRIINNNKYIEFNSLPDNQPFTIRPKFIAEQLERQDFSLIYLSPNPVRDHVELSFETSEHSDVNIVFCDLRGRVFIKEKIRCISGVNNLFVDTSTLAPGLYYLRLFDSKTGINVSRKVLKL